MSEIAMSNNADAENTHFDAYLGIDWSGAKGQYRGIAIAECRNDRQAPRLIPPPGPAERQGRTTRQASGRHWRRAAVVDYLCQRLAGKERLLIGLDFAFSLPWIPGEGYLAGRVPEVDTAFELWQRIDAASADACDFHAGPVIQHPDFAPSFWTQGPQPPDWRHDKRLTEIACAEATGTRPETPFKLIGAKQVGKASLSGIRCLRAIRHRLSEQVAIWPFEPIDGRSVLLEIYPTLFRHQALRSIDKIREIDQLALGLDRLGSDRPAGLPPSFSDHEGDALISAAGMRWWVLQNGRLPRVAPSRVSREGWIFGVDTTGLDERADPSVEALLRHEGFMLFDARGSHRTFHSADGRLLTVVVPHGNRKHCHPVDIRKILELVSP